MTSFATVSAGVPAEVVVVSSSVEVGSSVVVVVVGRSDKDLNHFFDEIT